MYRPFSASSAAGAVGAAVFLVIMLLPSGLVAIAASTRAAQPAASGSWTPSDLPAPSVLPNGNSSQAVYLQSAACSSALFCVIVGYATDGDGNNFPLAETYSDGTWTASVLPMPANASHDFYDGELSSVSCPADGVCAAVGDYYSLDTSQDVSYQNGLLEQLSEGVWTATEAQLPEGPDSGLVNLNAVSCSDTNDCTAVGDVFNFDAASTYSGLDYTLQSGTWQMQVFPMPSNFQNSLSITGVACPDDEACVAVGTYEDSAGDDHGLILTLGRELGQLLTLRCPRTWPRVRSRARTLLSKN